MDKNTVISDAFQEPPIERTSDEAKKRGPDTGKTEPDDNGKRHLMFRVKFPENVGKNQRLGNF